ncbi:hypothetical protein ACFL9S_17805 [Erwinia sp. AnSW2-5]|uniref:hypothetical protein n=1 Tax=Erwinia sp. AnSW2-5 TaxID=3367692 RepID=UPI00385B43A9
MKWKTASISLLLVTLLVLLSAALMKRLPGQQMRLFTQIFHEEDVQLGYYDLLSRKREIYDTTFVTQDHRLSMTLTSPNDNRFGVKVNLLQRSVYSNKLIFDFKPIYYSDNNENRMIKSILGYGWQKRVVFDQLTFEGQHLVITPSGQILSTR